MVSNGNEKVDQTITEVRKSQPALQVSLFKGFPSMSFTFVGRVAAPTTNC